MALSKTKQAKAERSKRLARVKKVWPKYPFGVFDATVEGDIRRYLETGEVSGNLRWRLPS